MKQINFQLYDSLNDELKANSKRTGRPVSEIIRRALIQYLYRAVTVESANVEELPRPADGEPVNVAVMK